MTRDDMNRHDNLRSHMKPTIAIALAALALGACTVEAKSPPATLPTTTTAAPTTTTTAPLDYSMQAIDATCTLLDDIDPDAEMTPDELEAWIRSAGDQTNPTAVDRAARMVGSVASMRDVMCP
jgi:hypothetical protein